MAERTRVFVPEDFEETEDFHESVSQYLRRQAADFLWVENPQDPYTSWNCASFYRSGSIRFGKYRMILGEMLSRDDSKAVFEGVFACGAEVFECGRIVLDLSAKNGALSFSFRCGEDALRRLDAGVRYLMPLGEDDEDAGERGYLAEFYNSVLIMPADAVLSAHISPCELMRRETSYIAIPQARMQTNFLKPDGNKLSCTPSDGAALVFERTAASQAASDGRAYLSGLDFYLGLKGGFMCEEKVCMIPGLSAGEYFSVKDGFLFEPGHPALLAGEQADTVPEATAPWLRMKGDYYSSASGSPLYAMKGGVFRPFSAKAASFGSWSVPFPALAWSSADISAAEEGVRAENLLYDKRFGILAPDASRKMMKAGNGAGSETLAVTPAGICVGVREDGNWNWIGLGNVSGGEEPDIRLEGDLSAAKLAFINKDCFAAVSSAEAFEKLGGSGSLAFSVDGWEIRLPDGDWKENGTRVVMKYSRSFSIAEKMGDDPAFAALISSAYKDGEEIAEYHDLIRAVTDRDFEGLVLLNAQARGKALPEEMQAIVSGIPYIPAVYAAVNSSKITAEGGRIKIGKSAVAAFLHYEADEQTASGVGCFKTVGLSVRIAASKVTDFVSRSELFLPALLGEEINCCLVLDGTMTQASGTECFALRLASAVSSAAPRGAVESLRVDTVQMTLDAGKKKFTLSGQAAFVKEEACDLFSYKALAFENLFIRADDDGKLTEDYSGLRLNGGRSSVREGSFAERFGAQAAAYYTGMEKSPDSMGFFSVNTPVSQAEMEGKWNGVVLRIDTGFGGKLGDGALTRLDVLLAWSGKAYYFGARQSVLSGFSLAGVLGFGFGGIELAGEDGAPTIKFCNTGVKLLGRTFPDGGADLYVSGEKGKLGWYLVYDNYGEE